MEFQTLDDRLGALHDRRDLWWRLRDVTDAVSFLQRQQEEQAAQWQLIRAEQRQHCGDLANMYHQLRGLLRANRGGSGGEVKQQSAGGAAVLQDTLKAEVRDLLQNFKCHIEEYIEKTNHRLHCMEKCMDAFRHTAEENSHRLARQEERLVRLEEQQERLQQLVSSFATMGEVSQLRETLSQQLQSFQKDFLASTQRQNTTVDERLAKHEAQCGEERANFCRETTQAIDCAAQRLQGELEALTTHAAQTRAQVREVHAELSGAHARLVADTKDAVAGIAQAVEGLPRRVDVLQESVDGVQSALQRHGDVLSEQCLQGSLRGAFDEVKDWLQDLECRVLSRGEFDEAMMSMGNRLAALKRELLFRVPIEGAIDESIDRRIDAPRESVGDA